MDSNQINSKSNGENDLQLNSSDSENMSEDKVLFDDSKIDYSNRMKYHVKIPFPSTLFAESAMKSVGVDSPF